MKELWSTLCPVMGWSLVYNKLLMYQMVRFHNYTFMGHDHRIASIITRIH